MIRQASRRMSVITQRRSIAPAATSGSGGQARPVFGCPRVIAIAAFVRYPAKLPAIRHAYGERPARFGHARREQGCCGENFVEGNEHRGLLGAMNSRGSRKVRFGRRRSARTERGVFGAVAVFIGFLLVAVTVPPDVSHLPAILSAARPSGSHATGRGLCARCGPRPLRQIDCRRRRLFVRSSSPIWCLAVCRRLRKHGAVLGSTPRISFSAATFSISGWAAVRLFGDPAAWFDLHTL